MLNIQVNRILRIYREHEELFRDALSMYLKYQADFRKLLSPAYIGGVAAFLMLYKGCTKEYVGRFWEGFALGILPAYKQALCEIADRTRMDSWIASKLFLKYNYGIEVRSSKPLQPNQRALFINDKLYAVINVTQANAILAAKEDYYINKLMFLETGSLMKDATVWFDNKSMPLDTFKAKCLGQILLTGPYKVYIKRTGTQVDKLNTCNMSVTSYTITYK